MYDGESNIKLVGDRMRAFSFVLVLLTTIVWSEPSTSPRARLTTSSQGKAFFKMIPERVVDESGKVKEAFGVAYKVTGDGEFVEQWRTSGWYSARVYISEGAQFLVRMGPWSPGYSPLAKDLAIMFYKNGKYIKSYLTSDLVKDKKALLKPSSHYTWVKEAHMQLYGNSFFVVTVDDIKYEFNLESGDIVKQEKKK